MRRKENEVEAVVDLVNTVFHGDACHRLSLRYFAGGDMQIWLARYSAWRHFARRICDLASQIGSATPRAGPQPAEASENRRLWPPDKKTLHCVVKTIPLLPQPHRICGNVYWGRVR